MVKVVVTPGYLFEVRDAHGCRVDRCAEADLATGWCLIYPPIEMVPRNMLAELSHRNGLKWRVQRKAPLTVVIKKTHERSFELLRFRADGNLRKYAEHRKDKWASTDTGGVNIVTDD